MIRIATALGVLALAFVSACADDGDRDAGDVQPDRGFLVRHDGGGDAMDVVGDAATCNGPMVEDLAALGTATSTGLVYASDNTNTSDALSDALQPGTSTCAFSAIHERIFAYTLHTSAALRVSTDNAGSDPNFDSVIFVLATPCTLPPTVLACNDDDPFAPASPHVTLSLATTPVLDAGTTVWIAVAGFAPAPGSSQSPNPAGETGAFQLTVDEIPALTAGESCDPSGRQNVCPNGSACIAATPRGGPTMCVAFGSAPGAPCLSGSMCLGGLSCDSSGGVCFQTVGDGAACDRLGTSWSRCGMGSSCVSTARGEAPGTCQPDGTVAGGPCASDGTCSGAGLVCHARPGQSSICATLLASGAACNTARTACPMGESCVTVGSGAAVGTCTPDGTVAGTTCRADAPECDDDLACITGWLDRTCRSVGRTDGASCGGFTTCGSIDVCVIGDPTEPLAGACAAAGNAGGVCNAAGPACNDLSLVCSNPMQRTQGHCLRTLMLGGACDTAGKYTRCPSGSTCVRQGTSGANGTCTSNGTVAGAACRTDGTCDTGLACARSSGGICQTPTTSICDPHFATLQCPMDQVCLATALEQGTCATPIAEQEPNDANPAPGNSIPAPSVVVGALGSYDLDCFGIDVPALGTVTLQANGLDGLCGMSIELDLYAPDGSYIGGDSGSGAYGCPRIDGSDAADFPWASGLEAGRYTVCVWQHTDRSPVPAYALSLATTAP